VLGKYNVKLGKEDIFNDKRKWENTWKQY
jgi:hypothetical protein